MPILIDNVQAMFEVPQGGFRVETTSVYIKNGKIASLDGLPEGERFTRRIDGAGKLLIPGLINCHTHIPMTFLRNAADDLKFHEWLFGRIIPLEKKLEPEDCYWATQLGLMEMLRTGTTCFSDMYFHIDHIARAITDAKAYGVLSRGVTSEQCLREALDEIDRWEGSDHVNFMLAPHAPYTCDPDYQREIVAEAARLDVGIHTHISESEREVKESWEQHGKSPVTLMDETGILTPRTVAAHCVHLDDRDIETLARRGVHVAHNPVSNLKLANGVAPVPKLRAAGVNVTIGTDGPASNNTMNMFRDLSLTAILHKGVTGDPEMVTADQALEMVWANGARALGLSDSIGKLAVGYRADLALIDLSVPNLQPANDPIRALAYAATGHEVALTMVGGKILYEDGEYPTIDMERVGVEVEAICRRVGLRG
ncbi:MAG: amidohydrolase [Oscillospiraceae bacterium]|nr:amidohydrolase [Oscillospiraceae bacterium]